MNKKIQGIILAAGLGSRLKNKTKNKPKALIEAGGKPLIAYAINFLKLIGIDQINIIGGFCFDDLKAQVRKIDSMVNIRENRNYTKGNLFTLDAIINEIDKGFLLMNTDHIYQKPISEKIKNQLTDRILAFTDYDRELGDDDMKVLACENRKRVIKISKQLTDYHLGYVGMTFVPENKLDIYKKTIDRAKEFYGENAVVENILQILADEDINNVEVGDISGFKWLEIDFLDELERAEIELKNNLHLYY